MTQERPLVQFVDVAEAEAWFEAHHADSDGVWIAIAKKASKVSTPSYEGLVELALMFGWIDSQKRKLDTDCSQQAFTPRRARSPWSQVNREKAEVLIASGRMRPAGLAAVEAAKANGRWDAAYARATDAEMPADFLAELEKSPAAKEFFATLNKQNTFPVYYRLQDAKKPETRARRIAKFIDMFERGEKFY